MARVSHIAEKAAVKLTIKYAFWAELFYSMEIVEVDKNHPYYDHVKTEATDGRRMWINVDFFSKLKVDDQVNELVHELSHKMLIHPSRRGHRDPKMWNVACDYAINEMMVAQGHVLQPDWLRAPQYAGWLAENIYTDLKKQEQPPAMPEHRQDIEQPEGTPEEQEAQEADIQATVDRAIQNAKARGDLPQGIEDNVALSYKAVGEPWYNHLARYMQALRDSQYDWRRLNRRTLRSHGTFSPMHQSEALGPVVIFMDTSGSCWNAQTQCQFASHINAIMSDAKPESIKVVYFDAQCYPEKMQTFEAGEVDLTLKPVGGGGTRFQPIFDCIEKEDLNPELLIVVTDMENSDGAPDEPHYPVVWADVAGHTPPSFGEWIVLSE
jgi:predicted metal-dependent peptidase